jgi:hypothetical protein
MRRQYSSLCRTVHYDLWKSGYEHGDISPGMLLSYSDGRTCRSVLADCDLALMDDSTRGPGEAGVFPFADLNKLEVKAFKYGSDRRPCAYGASSRARRRCKA